ncbi:MAG: hypothetical protein E7Z87_02680 [Cyanobacteria bacterium SIG26]|nr:hypothetical protein [Cyanobacteria bacterium SIG26]
MKILSSIGKIFKGPTSQIIAKTAGLAGLGLVAYDAHHIGKVNADLYASHRDAVATDYYVNNSMYSTNMSKVQDGIKTKALEMQLNQGWRRFFNTGIGYIKGFGSMIVEHIIPVGLSVAALLTKGKASKICAGGLGIYAAYEVIRNFFGFGVPKGPLQP